MKLQKLAPVLLLSTVAGTAYADGDDSGLYFGAGVGVESFESAGFLNVGPTALPSTGTTPPVVVDAAINVDLGDTDFAGTIYLGYGFDFDELFDIDALEDLYLALEVNATFSSIKADANLQTSLEPVISTLTAVSSSLELNNSYGVSLLPGFWVTEDVLVYLRGGVVWGHIESKIIGAISNDTKTTNQFGGQFGGGLEYGVTENVNLRAEYIYTAYQSFDQKIPTAVIQASSTQNLYVPMNAHFNLNTSISTVSINYRF